MRAEIPLQRDATERGVRVLVSEARLSKSHGLGREPSK